MSMKKTVGLLCLVFLIASSLFAQADYDSITVSRSRIEQQWHRGKWIDSLKADRYSPYIFMERRIWKRDEKTKKQPAILATVNRVKKNGEGDVAKCFIPRHSINFYKQGKIVRFLAICFECNGLRFSDGPYSDFVKSDRTREKQMEELKTYFKGLL